jgi:hypothetical protein
MAEFFHTVVGILLEKLQHKTPKMAGILEGFRDVLATDSTLVRLHGLLERSYPANWTNHTKAVAKLHVVMSVKGAGTRRRVLQRSEVLRALTPAKGRRPAILAFPPNS